VAFVFREFEPHPALAPFVDRFWARSGAHERQTGPMRILPDGCIDLIVDLAHGGDAVVVGSMTRATLYIPNESTRLVAVRFRPGGAGPLLNVAAHELTDLVVDSHALGLRWLAPLLSADDTKLGAAVRVLERILLSRLPSIAAPNRLVTHAVSALFAPAPPSVATLARELGWSRQHLTRALRFHVGVSSMQLARVARLQRAVELLQRGEGSSLAETAVRLGYFDQAHMSRDFRELAGVTPQEAATSAGSIFPIRSLLRGLDLRR
jgi:AraC-like DNA-binding protein